MWIFTRHGFFSATLSPTHPGMMQLRARLKSDLKALKEALGVGARIVETPPPADYRFRLVVSREELVAIVTAEVMGIDYHNFKGAVHDEPGQESKAGPYLRVWAAMMSLQNDREHRTPGEPDLFRPDEFHFTEPEDYEPEQYQEQPEGEPETWGNDMCICGNARRDHLHGRGHCLAPGCHCNAFVLASGQPEPASVDPLDNPKAPEGQRKRKSREALDATLSPEERRRQHILKMPAPMKPLRKRAKGAAK